MCDLHLYYRYWPCYVDSHWKSWNSITWHMSHNEISQKFSRIPRTSLNKIISKCSDTPYSYILSNWALWCPDYFRSLSKPRKADNYYLSTVYVCWPVFVLQVQYIRVTWCDTIPISTGVAERFWFVVERAFVSMLVVPLARLTWVMCGALLTSMVCTALFMRFFNWSWCRLLHNHDIHACTCLDLLHVLTTNNSMKRLNAKKQLHCGCNANLSVSNYQM